MENKEVNNLASRSATTNNFLKTLPYSYRASYLFRQGLLLEKIKKSIKSIRHYSKFAEAEPMAQPSNRLDHPSINKLKPFWISGFSDAESSFIISITKNTRYTSG